MAATIARWKATLVASSIYARQWRRVWPTLALATSVPIHASGAMRIIALSRCMLIVAMAMAAMRAAAATMQQRRASGQGEAFYAAFSWPHFDDDDDGSQGDVVCDDRAPDADDNDDGCVADDDETLMLDLVILTA